MRVLLDTHAFVWLTSGDRRLSALARRIVEDRNNDTYVSIVSCWEIAIKVSLGRLEVAAPLAELFTDEIEGNGMTLVTVERSHLLELTKLPLAHKDPFDRLLAAQARIANLALISNDQAMDAYGISRIW